ncbi:MAG TPA: hypothetical protein VFN37_00790 [Candidatus Baltobacteraceae bacterium]|nr:hypothetical protein [Candidatus Baltobacteraceae bacterium]
MNERPAPSALYDWSMALASLWLSGGMFIDTWHHFHETIETFFEPGHAVLYAGLLASYVFTGIAVFVFRRRGYALRFALPPGYELTVAGLAVTMIGGMLDMIKHQFWGFERTFDALVSPSHLVIGAGMFLIITGPIRSAFLRKAAPRTLSGQLPMVLAVASMMELLHWGTQFIFHSNAELMNAPVTPTSMPHDVLTLLSIEYYKQGIGLLSVLIQSILLAGFALYVVRRLRLAPGGLVTLLLVGNVFIAAAQANYSGQFWDAVAASVAAGVCGELIAVGPDTVSEMRWSAFAFAVPAVYWIVLLSVLGMTMGGLWWTPDIIVGSILYAGFTGLFVNSIAATRPAGA